MSKDFQKSLILTNSKEGISKALTMLTTSLFNPIKRMSYRPATDRDHLGFDSDISDPEGVKVLQFGVGEELPFSLSTEAVVEMALAWADSLNHFEDYPKGLGYRDSYERGVLISTDWTGTIELVPVTIGISK